MRYTEKVLKLLPFTKFSNTQKHYLKKSILPLTDDDWTKCKRYQDVPSLLNSKDTDLKNLTTKLNYQDYHTGGSMANTVNLVHHISVYGIEKCMDVDYSKQFYKLHFNVENKNIEQCVKFLIENKLKD